MSNLLRLFMGNCLISCRPYRDTTPVDTPGNGKILRIVKTDGKVLEYRSSVLVKELLVNFNGFGVGASYGSSQFLAPDYELKLGQVYYLLPCLGPVLGPAAEGGVKRIKVVITKQQLQELLSKNISVDDVLSGLQRAKASDNDDDDDESDSSTRSWKPELETIPE